MLSFVEQLIKAFYNLNDLLWYSTAEKILFLQCRSTLIWYVGCILCALSPDMGVQCSNGSLNS